MFNFTWEGVGASKRLFGMFSVHIKYVVGKMNLFFPTSIWLLHGLFSSHEPSAAAVPGSHSVLLPYLKISSHSWWWAGSRCCFNPMTSRRRNFNYWSINCDEFLSSSSSSSISILQSWACGFWRTLGILGEPFTRKVFPTSSRCLRGKHEKSLVHWRKHQMFKVIWNPLSVSALDSNQAQ